MGKKVFLTEDVKLGEDFYAGGAIYELDVKDNVQQSNLYEDLKATGKLTEVDFANLDALERKRQISHTF